MKGKLCFRMAIASILAPLWAQSPPLASVVRGNIVSDRPAAVTGPLLVELESPQRREVRREHASHDGSFEFRMLPPGTYELRITTLHGALVRQQFVTINEHNEPLLVKLPATPGSTPAQGLVSAARLGRPIPARALKAFAESEKRMRKGDQRASIECLERALRIEPSYMEAHNNLGTRYMAMGQHEKALSEFQTAAGLEPNSGLVQANLSIALMTLKRLAESEAAARQAVRLDPTAIKNVYTLGLVLEARRTQPEEALQHLSRVREMFPNARIAAARVLLRLGRITEAAAELRAYVTSPDVQHRASAQAWLAAIESATQKYPRPSHSATSAGLDAPSTSTVTP